MTQISATEVKQRFGQVMEEAKRGPVIVQTHGRDSAVILDIEEYERLRRFEDAYWVARAEEAAQEGFLGAEETARFLAEKLQESEGEG
jgi:prevent-host-death family protein